MHFAYIDPGAGSMLVQAVIAAVVSVPFFFRRNIGGLVRRLRGPRDSAATRGQTPDTEV
jgi:hypothetical protein